MNREQAWLVYQYRMNGTGRTPHEADFLAGWIAGQAEARDILAEVKGNMLATLGSMKETTGMFQLTLRNASAKSTEASR